MTGLLGLRLESMSLRRKLVLWGFLPQLVLWLASGVTTYRLAVHHANEVADATLSQAARTLARQVRPIPSGLLIDFPQAAQQVLEADPNDRLLYTVSTPPGRFILGNNTIPLPPHDAQVRYGDPYFYDGNIVVADPVEKGSTKTSMVFRIVALTIDYQDGEGKKHTMLVQVARNTANRAAIWKNILIETLLPHSILIALMTIVVWAATGAGLAPLLRLRREVEGRSPMDLTPLQIDAAPREVRSLVQALNVLLASVRQNVEAQKRFIADAAHQLRTPLAGLKTQTELALRFNADPSLAARLELVHRSAMRGAHLVNRLLMLARAEPETMAAEERGLVDLVPLVKALTSEMVPRAMRADVDLGMAVAATQSADKGFCIIANDLLLREALQNILDNAIEYAGPGSTVTAHLEAAGDSVVVKVVDNGPGIPEALHERVLERFVRATDKGLGCGLGLAIVREIAVRFGGSIALRNVAPHGLEVALTFPSATPSSASTS
jgi:two-component system sensor histidine kinase TctE